MRRLLIIPVLVLLLMLQLAIVSRIQMLNGAADIMLISLIALSIQKNIPTVWVWGLAGGLMVSLVTALPFIVPIAGYLLIVIAGRAIQRSVVHAPVLAMFLISIVGTLFVHALSMIALFINGVNVSIADSLTRITMPSVLLNLILCLPIYLIMTDLSKMDAGRTGGTDGFKHSENPVGRGSTQHLLPALDGGFLRRECHRCGFITHKASFAFLHWAPLSG